MPDEPGASSPVAGAGVVRSAALRTLAVSGVLIGLWLLWRVRTVLVLVLVAFFFACAAEPPVRALVRRGLRRGASTGVVFIAGLIVGAGVTVAMGALLVQQGGDLVDNISDLVVEAAATLSTQFGWDLSAERLTASLDDSNGPLAQAGQQLAGGALGLGTSVVAFLVQALAVVTVAYYLVADGIRFRRTVCSVLPGRQQLEVLRAWELAIDRTSGYLYYRGGLAFVSTIVHTVAFALLGLPNPLALGVWVGLLSQFVPTIGTYLAGTLPVLVGLTESLGVALTVLGVIVVYQQIENYGLAPRLGARTMNVHPAVGILAVLAGASLVGAVGALLALPVTATIQAFAGAYVRRHEVVSQAADDDVTPRAQRPEGRGRTPPPE